MTIEILLYIYIYIYIYINQKSGADPGGGGGGVDWVSSPPPMGINRGQEQLMQHKNHGNLLEKDSAHFVFIRHALTFGVQKLSLAFTFSSRRGHIPSQSPLTVT